MNEKIIIFGASGTAKRVYEMIKKTSEVLFFVDNDSNKWNEKFVDGIRIKNPNEILNTEYDSVVIATIMGLSEVEEQLKNMDIPQSKILKNYTEIAVKSRISFLKRYSEYVYDNTIEGCVAEAGVFRGEFSKQINYYFYDRKCFLFDTFEGFSENDFKYEEKESYTDAKHFKETSEELVFEKMPNKNNIIIKKGYFPNTTEGIKEKFCFVNLDMDLYQPTLEGLRFFYDKMSKRGIILIHDYFSEIYPNIKKAIRDFEKERELELNMMPIGDDFSIAIIK